MTRRERWDKLPLQAHFYPMPTMAYIEDEAVRVTVASRQPLGVASLASGQLEVLLYPGGQLGNDPTLPNLT